MTTFANGKCSKTQKLKLKSKYEDMKGQKKLLIYVYIHSLVREEDSF